MRSIFLSLLSKRKPLFCSFRCGRRACTESFAFACSLNDFSMSITPRCISFVRRTFVAAVAGSSSGEKVFHRLMVVVGSNVNASPFLAFAHVCKFNGGCEPHSSVIIPLNEQCVATFRADLLQLEMANPHTLRMCVR